MSLNSFPFLVQWLLTNVMTCALVYTLIISQGISGDYVAVGDAEVPQVMAV